MPCQVELPDSGSLRLQARSSTRALSRLSRRSLRAPARPISPVLRPDFALEAQRQPALVPAGGRKRRLGLRFKRLLGSEDRLEPVPSSELSRGCAGREPWPCFGLMKRRRAISVLVIPRASRPKTSRSRRVRTPSGSSRSARLMLDSSSPCELMVRPTLTALRRTASASGSLDDAEEPRDRRGRRRRDHRDSRLARTRLRRSCCLRTKPSRSPLARRRSPRLEGSQ